MCRDYPFLPVSGFIIICSILKRAQAVDPKGICGLFALLSVIIIFVESGAGTQYHLTFDEWHVFVWLELMVTLVFTCEYLLRVFCWPNPAKYVFSFWGFIDLATNLPLYVMWLWPEIPRLRFRLAGHARDPGFAHPQAPALYAVVTGILAGDNKRTSSVGTFYSFIAIVMIVFGALMYLIEGPKYGFTTLNASVYWAIVTVDGEVC